MSKKTVHVLTSNGNPACKSSEVIKEIHVSLYDEGNSITCSVCIKEFDIPYFRESMTLQDLCDDPSYLSFMSSKD
jgi:hypothetical protein